MMSTTAAPDVKQVIGHLRFAPERNISPEAAAVCTSGHTKAAWGFPNWRPDGDSNPGYRRERAMS
jgi:hypothetical protein